MALSQKLQTALAAFDEGTLSESDTLATFKQVALTGKQGDLSESQRAAFDRLAEARLIKPLSEDDIAALNAGMAFARKTGNPGYLVDPQNDPSVAFDGTGIDGVDQFMAVRARMHEAIFHATRGRFSYEPVQGE